MSSFDKAQLHRLGLYFETEEEEDLFSEVVTTDFEIRIGTKIDQYLAHCSLDMFPDDDDTFEEWAMAHPEICREVIDECHTAICEEILRFKAEIPGLIKEIPDEIRSITVEDLDLSIRSFNCLKRANLYTVGDIFDRGDLSNIRNLGKKNVDEIHSVIIGLIR